jgi:hypothetical protein
VVQAVPQVPNVSGPQNNAPALQAPNTSTVVATLGSASQTVPLGSRPPQVSSGLDGGQSGDMHIVHPDVPKTLRVMHQRVAKSATQESELVGLNYSVIYRNYETRSLMSDLGVPLLALASGYEFFLFLEGRPPLKVESSRPGARGTE